MHGVISTRPRSSTLSLCAKRRLFAAFRRFLSRVGVFGVARFLPRKRDGKSAEFGEQSAEFGRTSAEFGLHEF